jgi:CIC family chloride channel protein
MASPGAYAVVGMGAMVAASTHAPITAILIIFEMTGDYAVIVGLMVSCILGTVIAQRLRRESIYTIKLLRRGIDLHAGREVNVLRKVKVHDILNTDLETVPRTETLSELYWRMARSPHYEFIVVDDRGNLVGIISVDDLRRAIPLMEELKQVAIAEDIMSPAEIYLREDDNLDTAMRQFGKQTLEELPVLPAGNSMKPLGTIQRQDVINAYNKEILKVDLAGSVSARLEAAARFKSWETIAGYVLALVEAPPHLCQRPLASLQLRNRGIQIVLVERVGMNDESRFVFPTKDTELTPGDRAIVFGRRDNVEKLLREVHG